VFPEEGVWRAERARILDQRERRARPGTEAGLAALGRGSKGISPLGRRPEAEEGRQGAKRTLEGGLWAPSKPGAGDKPATRQREPPELNLKKS